LNGFSALDASEFAGVPDERSSDRHDEEWLAELVFKLVSELASPAGFVETAPVKRSWIVAQVIAQRTLPREGTRPALG